MSYPLINGAVINGADGVVTDGIDLAVAAQIFASRWGGVAAVVALETGTPEVALQIKPPGIDLAVGGLHAARYNTALHPPGIDLCTGGTALSVCMAQKPSIVALDVGAPRAQQGVDAELTPDGIDLALSGVHVAYPEQPPANVVASVEGVRALELGTPAMETGGLIAYAASATPMQMGVPGARSAHVVAGYAALQTGQPGVQVAARVPQASALGLGVPTVAVRMAMSGIDLSVHTPGRVLAGGLAFAVVGHEAFELGVPGVVGTTVRVRQGAAFTLGTPSADRGALC